MKQFWRAKNLVERCEFVVASLLTLLLIGLHAMFLFRAGPLWRDEISSLSLATKPTLRELWKFLPFDPFPVTYFLILRAWHALGFGGTDFGLRILGFLIGLSIIAALWLSCYLINKSPPLWPLALFAFNPLVLECGDSLRPYGLGILSILLTFAFIWRITFAQFRSSVFTLAIMAALLSVQSLFTNALLLFAIGIGALVVLLKRKAWREFALVAMIGGIAALSLLPFFPVMAATRAWSGIMASGTTIGRVMSVGNDALADGGAVAHGAWLFFGGALLSILALTLSTRFVQLLDLKRDRLIFLTIALLLSLVSFVLFFWIADYLTFPRYFLTVIALGALSFHIVSDVARRSSQSGIANICAVILVAASAFPDFRERAQMRMTNCAELAAAVEAYAQPADLIVVTSFFYAVAFAHYYHGSASWHSLPDVADHSLHRWDLLKERLNQPEPARDLRAQVEFVLRSGHKVFLVGDLAPASFLLGNHALHGRKLALAKNENVNPMERLELFEVSGWKEASPPP